MTAILKTLVTAVLALLAPLCGYSESAFTNLSVYLPDDDPIRFNGQTILLYRGNYDYRLHVPATYDESRQWPCLFVIAATPGSAEAAEDDGWLVVEIPSGGSDEATVAGFVCAHDDVARRYRLTGGLKFLAASGEDVPRGLGVAELRPGIAGFLATEPRGHWEHAAVFEHNTNFLLCVVGTTAFTNRVAASTMQDGLRWMEEQVTLELPYDPPLKEYYVDVFNRWADVAAKAEPDAKSNLVARLQRLADVRELSSEPRIAERLKRLVAPVTE
jgi:hypothetical protein